MLSDNTNELKIDQNTTSIENNLNFEWLFSFKKAQKVFETADYSFVELPSFKKFSKALKMRRHDSIILAADTGIGKSSLALNILSDVIKSHPSLYFNFENSEQLVHTRLASINSGIEISDIEKYQDDEDIKSAVDEAMLELASYRKPFGILDHRFRKLDDLERVISQFSSQFEDPTFVIIDHALLLYTGTSKDNDRYIMFTEISQRLRLIAETYNIIMISLLQQNRRGKEDSNFKAPTNSSLKESGSWENDATQIFFLWNDESEHKKKLTITKTRESEAVEVALDYHPSTQIYREAEVSSKISKNPYKRSTKRDNERDKIDHFFNIVKAKDKNKDVLLEDLAEAMGISNSALKTKLSNYGGYLLIDGIVQQTELGGTPYTSES